MKSDRQLKRWWGTYNRLYFDNGLPDTIVFWEAVSSAYATHQVVDGQHVIRINPALTGWQSVARFALLHEQVHQRLYPYHRHGKRFNVEMLRLAGLGRLRIYGDMCGISSNYFLSGLASAVLSFPSVIATL
jgi:hypothetical protein